jgi:glycosyltransferase involved in cell wall biosynthesis
MGEHGVRRRLLLVHPSPDLYGSDRQLLETVGAAVAAGWRAHVLLPEDGPLHGLLRERGATTAVMAFPVLRKSVLSPAGMLRWGLAALPAVVRMVRTLRRLEPDLLYVNTLTIPPWLLAGRLSGVPALCHVHEAEDDQPWVVRTALNLPLVLARTVVANSAATLASVTATRPRVRRAAVVHNGVPDDGAPREPRQRRPADPLAVAVVGRLSPKKGVDLAVEAVARLRATGMPVTLDLYGSVFPGYEWFEDQLRRRVARPDLAGAVRLHGYVHPTRAALEAADVVLVPSRAETFGNSAVEAMLAARPVVAARVQGLAEVLADAPRTGLLVEPGSADALAEGLRAVAADPGRAREQGRQARAYALEHFSLGRYGEALTALLDAGAATRRRGPSVRPSRPRVPGPRPRHAG